LYSTPIGKGGFKPYMWKPHAFKNVGFKTEFGKPRLKPIKRAQL
jgi:hypothetical protein